MSLYWNEIQLLSRCLHEFLLKLCDCDEDSQEATESAKITDLDFVTDVPWTL